MGLTESGKHTTLAYLFSKTIRIITKIPGHEDKLLKSYHEIVREVISQDPSEYVYACRKEDAQFVGRSDGLLPCEKWDVAYISFNKR